MFVHFGFLEVQSPAQHGGPYTLHMWICEFYIFLLILVFYSSQVALVVKKEKKQTNTSSANKGDIRDVSSIPGSGRSSGGGHGNSLQYSCLENPSDRGAWWAMVQKVTKTGTRLKWLSMHTILIFNSSLFFLKHIYILLFYMCYIKIPQIIYGIKHK